MPPLFNRLIASASFRAAVLALLFGAGSRTTWGADEGDAAQIAADTKIIELEDSTESQITAALRDRADHYSHMGNTDKAIADLTAALAVKHLSDDDIARSLYDRARIYEGRELDKAVADFTRVIDLTPDWFELALCGRADCYEGQEKVDQALADFATVIALHGIPATSTTLAMRGRADCLEHIGEHEKAIAEYTKLLEFPQVGPDMVAAALTGRGDVHYNLADYDAAIADFSKALETKDLSSADAAYSLIERAGAHFYKGQADLALADYNRVIAMADLPAIQSALALIGRGAIYIDLAKYENGLSDLNRAVSLKDVGVQLNAETMLWRATCLRKMGQTDKAIADLTAVLAMNDLPPLMAGEARADRGRCLALLGKKEQATADYAAAIVLTSTVIDAPQTAGPLKGYALEARASIEFRTGSDKAMEDARRSQAILPRNATVLYTIATLQVQQGKFDDARKSIDQGIALRYPLGTSGVEQNLIELRDSLNGPPETAVFLGWIYLKAGMPDRGAPELKKYLEAHPQGPLVGWAKELLATPATK